MTVKLLGQSRKEKEPLEGAIPQGRTGFAYCLSVRTCLYVCVFEKVKDQQARLHRMMEEWQKRNYQV